MPTRKQIQPGEKVPLKLTAAERKLILKELIVTGMEYEELLQATPTGKPVMMTLDDLEDFGGYIAAEANHCDDRKKEKKLDRIFEKVQDLLDKYTDEEPPQTVKIEDAKQARMISNQAVQIAEWTAQALVAAAQLRIKTKPIGHFPVPEGERAILAMLPVRPKLKKKLASGSEDFTVAEVAEMAMAVAENLSETEPMQQVALLMTANSLINCLQERFVEHCQPKATASKKVKGKPATDTLFQFKITLLGAEPPIWRRIQIRDCTLDELHEHIQTAMGWTNSHLHQFEIKGDRYGDPDLLDDGFGDYSCSNSLETRVSDIVPKSGKRFSFQYEYDFGDGWQHEVLFEGCPTPEKRKKYPLCLEGERACPPEDVGGIWGYATFLEAKDDPQHEDYEMYAEWCADFDPEAFDPKQATKDMKQGLPDWRELEDEEDWI